MNRIALLFLAIFVFPISVAHADDPRIKNSIYPVIVSAMDDIVKGDLKKGINKIIPYTVNQKTHTPASIDKFVAKRNKFNRAYGRSLNYTLAKTQSIGKNVVKYLFLESLDNKILKWTFIVYKPEKKWKVLTFKWDAQMGELFE